MLAIGGMRNPHTAVGRMPKLAETGALVLRILEQAVQSQPDLVSIGRDILTGRQASPIPAEVITGTRELVVAALGGSMRPRRRTARASTPLQANVIQAWGERTGDPDTRHLCEWLDHGAPLGYSQNIPSVGIFPRVEPEDSAGQNLQDLHRSLEGWQNYTSAEQETEEVNALIADYVSRGFCHTAETMEEATAELGQPPVLNKLGLIVKVNDQGVKKCRLIWDLRESRANAQCCQGERILLPRLLDLAQQAVRQYRLGNTPWLAAVDVKDAFMNIPAGADKRFTVAARPHPSQPHQMQLVIFDTLVFGAGSSPTLWGRYAAWLGRSAAAVLPRAGVQIYVDDPAFVLTGTLDEASRDLTILLMWFAIVGFPVKLSKAEGGKSIGWVGAKLELDDAEKSVRVTIPAGKVSKIQDSAQQFLRKPVIGKRQLRSYAGALSFVAGLVPHLRPFLSSLWAVLGGGTSANDGAGKAQHSGKLVHTRRIRPALRWIEALVKGRPAPLQRTLESQIPGMEAEVVNDASPWRIGGVLKIGNANRKCFSSAIPTEALRRFKAQLGLSKYNTLWEGLALLVAFRLWLPELGRRAAVRAKSDNLGVLSMLAKGGAKSRELNSLAREFALDQALRS